MIFSLQSAVVLNNQSQLVYYATRDLGRGVAVVFWFIFFFKIGSSPSLLAHLKK
jgi:hypothetical protein